MKNFQIILILILTLPSQIYPQTDSRLAPSNKISINTTYFILGTLSDYMGRFAYVNKQSQIDRYHAYEKPLMDYLDDLIQKEFMIEIKPIPDKIADPSLYETYSSKLSLIINSYFKRPYLILDSLKNQPELNRSYLAGKYYRYGRKINDSIYSIQLANSADHKVIDSLFKRDGCTKIHFKYLDNVPAQFIYYFIPTSELKKYLDSITKQKKVLDNFYNKMIMATLKLGKNDINKMTNSQPLTNPEIIELFK